MELAAVLKARALAFLDIDELNKNGKLRFVDVIAPIVQRYDFKAYPTKLDEINSENGATFSSGRLGDIVVGELKVYPGLTYVETLSSTDDSQKVVEDLLNWGTSNLGFTTDKRTIRHWAYVSQLTFYSDIPLLQALSSPIEHLAQKTGQFVSQIFGEKLTYHPLNFVVGHDPAVRKNGIASFTIQPRLNVNFEQNKFFSEAPLPTNVHLQFLRELEEEAKKS
jgi:hypothetical protein